MCAERRRTNPTIKPSDLEMTALVYRKKGHIMTTLTHSETRHAAARKGQIPTSALIYFVLTTLAVSYGIAFSYIFLPHLMVPLFGELVGAHPLYFLMTWGPGIAGILVVLIYGGKAGLRSFLSRVLIWRCDAKWWALILIGLPLAFIVGSLIKGGPLLEPMENGLGEMIVVALIMFLLGPMEEFGWRGVAQPIVQRHIAPFWAGALIGVVWAFWHLPAFYLSGTVYGDWNFPLFLIGCITLAILVTPIFNASRGSLLLPMLFHWQLIMPIWPDGQPWDTWILVGVTAAVVWFKRDMMFSRQGAVTDVIPT
jgi:membrane protease YdiL (CAAX protease family)